jgi:hypothetical protein
MQWLSQVIDAWLDANQSRIKGGMTSLLEDGVYDYEDARRASET